MQPDNIQLNARSHFRSSALFLKLAVCSLAASLMASLSAPSTAMALTVSPTALNFSGSQGTPAPSAKTVTFFKSGDRTKNWSVSARSSWITVTPSSGTIATEQDQISVSVNLSGLAPGTYSSNVVIFTETLRGRYSKTSIPVSLTVTGSGAAMTPSIQIAPTALSFSGIAGGANPSGQSLSLTNPTGGTLTWSLSDNATWLTLSTATGTTTTETDSITAMANLTGLAAGTYSAAITVSASGAANSPRVIPVTLTVSAATTSTPVIGLSVAGLTYAGTAGGTNPSGQPFTISNTGTGTLAWSANDNAAWLTLTPASGTNTGAVTASVNLTGLAAGTYNGTITVAATGAATKTIPVSLTVTPATTTTASATLTWGANTETDLAGYKIYVGTQSGAYGAPIMVGKVTSYQITNLTKGTTYYFAITAVDAAGNESSLSAEVSKSIF